MVFSRLITDLQNKKEKEKRKEKEKETEKEKEKEKKKKKKKKKKKREEKEEGDSYREVVFVQILARFLDFRFIHFHVHFNDGVFS